LKIVVNSLINVVRGATTKMTITKFPGFRMQVQEACALPVSVRACYFVRCPTW
jgi:hypothetical protein